MTTGMDGQLVAIIDDYARTHGLNMPPHVIASDLVAEGPTGIEQLLTLLGMSINAGDPSDNTTTAAGQAGRQAQLADALTKFPANEEQATTQLASLGDSDPMSQLSELTQTATGVGQSLTDALSSVLQPFTQLVQQIPQTGAQAIEEIMSAVSQSAGNGAAAIPEDLLGTAESTGGTAADLAGATSGAGDGLAGTTPAADLGPPATPPSTNPASASTAPQQAPSPDPSTAPRSGTGGMPMMPPAAMGGGAGDAKVDTKRITAPAVRNGDPVQGRVTARPSPPQTAKQDSPPPPRHNPEPDQKGGDDVAGPGS